MAPIGTSEEKQHEAQTLLNEATELRANGNMNAAASAHARAEKLLQEAVQVDPSNQKARLTLVTAYMNSGQKSRAKEEAKLMYHGQTTMKEDTSRSMTPRRPEESPRAGPRLLGSNNVRSRWTASVEQVRQEYPSDVWADFFSGKAPEDPRKKKPAQRQRSPQRSPRWRAPPPITLSTQPTPDDGKRIRIPTGDKWPDESVDETSDRLICSQHHFCKFQMNH
eukprot:gnl/MRDRNA2_/MRDRNA2_16036_c0_seq2.p1 gnl/MRDRNA2_/MRDRNA2_16036_c0~~gnl/MRDRNA2_/MRDRNA2_16036_c0_seq2.p1  ORF type:complete len:222 (-),score=46.40 gnl/MRDRNA2_/MRDRNA2_16036_c0_seq2:7-672(-)